MCLRVLTILIFFLVSSCQSGKNDEAFGAPGTQSDLEVSAGDYILFESNSSAVDLEYRLVLDKQILWLKVNDSVRVIIEGHCDERGTKDYNIALGAQRSNSVKNYLVARGISSARITTISYGKESNPVLGTGEEVWRQNRRAITIVKE